MSVTGGGRATSAILFVLLAVTVPSSATQLHADAAWSTDEAGPVLEERGITDVTYSGQGIATTRNSRTYVWQNGSTWIRATIQPFSETKTHRVCLEATAAGANSSDSDRTVRSYGCKEKTLGTVGTRVRFDLDPLGITEPGRYELVVTVRGGDNADNATVPIFVLERDADLDSDGLSNAAEIEWGTDVEAVDTDSDGFQDGPEVHSYGTDPAEADTDGDGLRDGLEIQGDTEPNSPDTDGDGLPDGAEVNQHHTKPTEADTDGDGLDDGAEVDKHGTDPTEADTDGDGLDDGAEVGTYHTNPREADTDGDGFTDEQEVLEYNTDPEDAGDRPAAVPWRGLPDGWSWGGLGLLFGLVLLSTAGFVTYQWTRETSSTTTNEMASDRGDPSGAEILSPEERVNRLLYEHGGEIRQQEIVELTDWSKAKVSRILSRMEDGGGDIERTRIGRENVVTLGDDAVDDPTDDAVDDPTDDAVDDPTDDAVDNRSEDLTGDLEG